MSDREIPIGTRVIVVATGVSVMLGKIGTVDTPLGQRFGVPGQGVDFGVHGAWFAPCGAVVPLPPEDEVDDYDWQMVGVPEGVPA